MEQKKLQMVADAQILISGSDKSPGQRILKLVIQDLCILSILPWTTYQI